MLKDTKRQLFITTAKGICCSLLATGLLLQTGTAPAFASSSGQNIINTGVLAANISNTELQNLNIRTTNLEAPTQAEDNNVLINEHEITLNIGDTFQIQLTDKKGNKINDVEWFVKVRVPYDILYTAEDYSLQDRACTVSNDGLVTAKTEGTTEVWAKYKNALYRCVINVKNKMDTDLENKVVEIADKFRHLNDVDKVMAVHDYLIDHIEYAYSHIVRRAYGALIEGKAVCQGYAQSFQKILSNLNIEGHTVIGWNISDDPVLHEWNRVKLDGKWYYIDLTWDDTPWVSHRNYKHFLINTPMLGRDHKDWNSLSGGAEADGNKYLYYAYKKNGILAKDKGELESILRSQINSNNLSHVDVNVAVPNTIPDYEIINIIKQIAGSSVTINEENNLRNTLGDYHHYCYYVGNIKAQQSTDVDLIEVKPLNSAGGTTTKLEFIFNKDVGNLTLDNIKIDGVHKTSLEKIATGTYELSFSEIMSRTDTLLNVQVNKRGYNIANNEKTVNISVVKEAKPEAVFEATGLKDGILKNIEAGMAYDLGNGIRHDITSSEPIKITTIYQTPISIVRKSTIAGKLDSDIQLIYPKNTREPLGVKAVNGKIIYVNRKMEYQKEGDNTWISCDGTEVTGLASGKYNVRYKADGIKLASSEITVTVNAVPGENNKDNKPSTKPDASGGSSSNNGGGSSVGGNNNSGGNSGSAGSSNGSADGGGFAGGGASFGGGFAGGGAGGFAGGGFAGGSFGGGSASSVNDKTDSALNNEKTNNAKTGNTQTGKIENTSVKSETVEDIKPAISKNVANFSKSALDNIIKSGVKTFDFTSNKIKLSFETNALKSLNKQSDSDIRIKAVTVNNTKLSDNAKKLIGKNSVYDLSISGTNGTKITKLGKGKVTISIPYKLGKKEKAENVAVYFIDKNGNVKKISGSVYDSKTKTFTFTTKSLLRFAVGRKSK